MSIRNITLGHIHDLQERVADIPEDEYWHVQWKTLLSDFRDRHGLTDRDAIDLSRLDIEEWREELKKCDT
jgi:hypothetical protein